MAKIIILMLAVIIFQNVEISLMIFIVSQPQDDDILQKASNKKVKCSLGALYGLPETGGADRMTCSSVPHGFTARRLWLRFLIRLNSPVFSTCGDYRA